MRFDSKAYERAFPRQNKPKPVVDADDVMTQKPPVVEEEKQEEIVKIEEVKEEVLDDGDGTSSKPDSE